MKNKNTKEKQTPFLLSITEDLDTDALSIIFKNTTNSYKFLFFLALIIILKRREFKVNQPIFFTEISVEMLVIAWMPYKSFHLSFGSQDTIPCKLDELALPNNFKNADELRRLIFSRDLNLITKLTDFVPYRLLSPFLKNELAHVDKGKWMIFEYAMPSIVNTFFEQKNLPYKFNSDIYKECEYLHINPKWANYFAENFKILHSWALSNWADYMISRNVNVENILNKLYRSDFFD